MNQDNKQVLAQLVLMGEKRMDGYEADKSFAG